MARISQPDEHELLERLREGDAGAFTILYNPSDKIERPWAARHRIHPEARKSN